jgi:hypothetical protein
VRVRTRITLGRRGFVHGVRFVHGVLHKVRFSTGFSTGSVLNRVHQPSSVLDKVLALAIGDVTAGLAAGELGGRRR